MENADRVIFFSSNFTVLQLYFAFSLREVRPKTQMAHYYGNERDMCVCVTTESLVRGLKGDLVVVDAPICPLQRVCLPKAHMSL